MQITYVNVFVSDLERSIDFFESLLGFERKLVTEEHGYASFASGPVSLGLAVAGPDQSELVGRHTGVGIAVKDLESEHRRLAGRGVAFPMPPTRQPWGGFMALMADPDGNVFYLDEVEAMHG